MTKEKKLDLEKEVMVLKKRTNVLLVMVLLLFCGIASNTYQDIEDYKYFQMLAENDLGILSIIENQNKLNEGFIEIDRAIINYLDTGMINEEENTLCEAYADLDSIQMWSRSDGIYYFIDNNWVHKDFLWESCLRK